MLLSSWLQVLRTAMRSNGLAFVLLAGIAAGAAIMSVNSGTEMLLEGNSAAFAFWFLLGVASALASSPSTGMSRASMADLSAVQADAHETHERPLPHA
jgi:hypothetical protein